MSLALAMTAGKTASAQTKGFTVNRFEPSERGSEWFMLESLDFRGKARPAIGVVADYMYRPFVLRRDPSDADRVTNSVVRNVFTIHPGFSLVLGKRLRLAGSLPIQLFQDAGAPQTLVRPLRNEQAIGDVRLGLDVRLLGGEFNSPFRLAVGGQVWLPTGSRDNYTSDGSTRVAPRLLMAGDIGGENLAFTYAIKGGVMFRTNSGRQTLGNAHLGHELQLAGSVGLRIAKRLVIGPEWFMNTTISGLEGDKVFGKEETAMEWLAGAHVTLPADFRIGAGAGTGITRGYGNPEARVLANLEFMPRADQKQTCDDRDVDGICDKEDACPDVAGSRSPNPAANGCQPDRDGDGVFDAEDACVDVPGKRSSDPAANGCPDKDGDGIADGVDACPDVAGVKSQDPKLNGCPPDADGDGILDNVDACPDKPGIKTDDPKTNGCPDPDLDKDGVLNDADACPNEPGKADPDPKKNGCPKAFVRDGQIKILDQVKFKYNSAAIEAGPFSEEILQAVMEQVQKHTDTIKGIRIEGHTDNKGSAAYNKKLSKSRATSVAQWLVNRGVDTSILAVDGLGQDKPIESNDTDAGRAANRRVEFHILDAAPATPLTLKAKAATKAAPKKK